MLQGGQVMKTIGKGIVRQDLDYIAIFVALLCSGFFVTLATFYRIPTSTSQAIVGGVLGIGLAVRAEIDYSKLITIAESWLICPIMVMILAYVLYRLLILLLRRIKKSHMLVQNALGRLAILSACYVAYSMGANNAGNAVGPIANLGLFHPTSPSWHWRDRHRHRGCYVRKKSGRYGRQGHHAPGYSGCPCRPALLGFRHAPVLHVRHSGFHFLGHSGRRRGGWAGQGSQSHQQKNVIHHSGGMGVNTDAFGNHRLFNL